MQCLLYTSICKDRQGYAVIISTSLNLVALHDKVYFSPYKSAHVGAVFEGMPPPGRFPRSRLLLYFEETASGLPKQVIRGGLNGGSVISHVSLLLRDH